MQFHQNQKGWSFIELLSVISLISVLYTFVLFPTYRSYYLETQLEMKAKQLFFALQWARNLAICYHTPVTLSPTQDSDHTSWNSGWAVTVRASNSQVPQLLKHYPKLLESQNLIWSGARGVKILEFDALGHATGYNGHFTLCYQNTVYSKTIWFIWVSPTGRIRLEKSRNASLLSTN